VEFVAKGAAASFTALDISRARAIGFAPKVDLHEGLRRTVEWQRAERRAAEALRAG
jgi:nucleoside-diphosphate-sugar epimerase